MPPQSLENYFVTEVTTAPPQKLHLMLIEGTIRLLHKTRRHWVAKEFVEAADSLHQAQRVVGEILSGFNRDANPELVNRVAAIYGYVLRTLMEISAYRDEQKLDGVLQVLDTERETWRMLCTQIGGVQADHVATIPTAAPIVPPASFAPLSTDQRSGMFSFEA